MDDESKRTDEAIGHLFRVFIKNPLATGVLGLALGGAGATWQTDMEQDKLVETIERQTEAKIGPLRDTVGQHGRDLVLLHGQLAQIAFSKL